MGETCSTQRAAVLKATALNAGSCSVLRPLKGDQDHKLNEGRRFADEYDKGSNLAPKVCLVRNKVTKATYVSYTLRRSTLPCSDREQVASLVRRLQSLDHPNICRLLEAFEDPGKKLGDESIHLIYEKAIGTPILKYVSAYGFCEANAANLIQQVARALKHGEDNGVSHGAVVPKNIFVASTGKVTLTDFGLAYLLKPSPLDQAREEDFAYLAPEALQPWLEHASTHKDPWGRQRHVETMAKPEEGSKAWRKENVRKDFWASAGDMWSLGVILFKVLRGRMPFRGKGALGLAKDIVNHQLDIKLDFHDILSDEACGVINALLEKSPEKRPSAEELLQHGWILKNVRVATAPLKKGMCKELSTFIAETHFKKMIMRMLVAKLPTRRTVELQEAFSALDANQDGQVTLLELKRALARFPEICEGLDAPVEEIFAAIDADGGGKVSLHEFLAATLDASEFLTDAVIKDAFRCLDTNGDGKICKEELAVAAREIDGQLGVSHVERLLLELEDEIGTGSLGMEDFVALVKEEGQKGVRNQAVAAAAGSQRWGRCCPCTVQRSRVETITAEEENAGNDLPEQPAPPQRIARPGSPSPRPASGRKDSRRPSKTSPRPPDSRNVREFGSPKLSARSARGRNSGTRSKSPAPDHEGSARTSQSRRGDCSPSDPNSAFRRMPQQDPSPKANDGGYSTISSDCSTDCSSGPTRGPSRT